MALSCALLAQWFFGTSGASRTLGNFPVSRLGLSWPWLSEIWSVPIGLQEEWKPGREPLRRSSGSLKEGKARGVRPSGLQSVPIGLQEEWKPGREPLWRSCGEPIGGEGRPQIFWD